MAIAANTTYIVTYFAPNGGYSTDGNFFGSPINNGPVHGLADGTDGGNGVYRYGNTAFPTDSYNKSNYWVDVIMNAG